MFAILQNEYIKRFTARGEIFSSELGRDCLPRGKRPKGETCAKASSLMNNGIHCSSSNGPKR